MVIKVSKVDFKIKKETGWAGVLMGCTSCQDNCREFVETISMLENKKQQLFLACCHSFVLFSRKNTDDDRPHVINRGEIC